jgi:carbon monoxide dehydrogenase subunit G
MPKYESSVTIKSPVQTVFDYMQDIDREREWQPSLREASQSPEGEPGVGTERRYVSEFLGRRFENVYVNTSYEPPHKVVYRSTPESDTQATGEITWEAVDGGTKVTMRVEAKIGGLLRLVPKAVIESVGRKELNEALARVKKLLEAQGA